MKNFFKKMFRQSQVPASGYLSLRGKWEPADYYVTTNAAGVTLMLVPVRHTFDSSSPVRQQINNAWELFLEKTSGKERVAVVEGGLRPVMDTPEAAFRGAGGEGGYATYLADRAQVETVCYELGQKVVLQKAVTRFDSDRVFLSYISDRIYQYVNQGSKKTLQEYLEPFFMRFNEYALGDTYDFEDVDRVCRAITKNADSLVGNPKLAYGLANPIDTDNPIREVAEYIALMRDRHILDRIMRTHKDGTSQFVVYGQSHVRLWLPALKKKLGL